MYLICQNVSPAKMPLKEYIAKCKTLSVFKYLKCVYSLDIFSIRMQEAQKNPDKDVLCSVVIFKNCTNSPMKRVRI